MEAAAASGLLPLEYMLNILRSDPPINADAETLVRHAALRFEASKAAAPYIHARLAPQDVPIKLCLPDGSISEQARHVMRELGAGILTPDQASKVMTSLAAHSRIIEVDELAKRVEALETARKHGESYEH